MVGGQGGWGADLSDTTGKTAGVVVKVGSLNLEHNLTCVCVCSWCRGSIGGSVTCMVFCRVAASAQLAATWPFSGPGGNLIRAYSDSWCS